MKLNTDLIVHVQIKNNKRSTIRFEINAQINCYLEDDNLDDGS